MISFTLRKPFLSHKIRFSRVNKKDLFNKIIPSCHLSEDKFYGTIAALDSNNIKVSNAKKNEQQYTSLHFTPILIYK